MWGGEGLLLRLHHACRLNARYPPYLHSHRQGHKRCDEQEDTQVEAEAVIECRQEAIGYASIDQEVSQWESNGCGNDKQTDIEASEKQSDVMRLGSIDLADGHLLAAEGSIDRNG